jgi:hypothetical protein
VPTLAFLTFSETARVITDRKYGDGCAALVAAAASGKITARARRKECLIDGRDTRTFDYDRVVKVSPRWWAQIDDTSLKKQIAYSVYLRPEMDALISQVVLEYHPNTDIPKSQRLMFCYDICFPEEEVDALWPPSDGDQAPSSSSAPLEPKKQALALKKAKHSEILEQARAVLASGPTWINMDRDLVPLVRSRLNAVGLKGGRDPIRDALRDAIKEAPKEP